MSDMDERTDMNNMIEELPHFSAGPVVLESGNPGVVDPAFSVDAVLDLRSAFDPFNNETALKLYDAATPLELLQIFEDGFVMESLLDAVLPAVMDNTDDVFAARETDGSGHVEDDMSDMEYLELVDEDPEHYLHP